MIINFNGVYSLNNLKQSYGRAIELENSRVFALVESGNVHMMLGLFRKVRNIHHVSE